jgi:[calcium/calmodulin-dependent protein kinase] kinase
VQELEKRPATANHTPEPKTPAPRVYGASTPESFERAQKEQDRRRRQEVEAEQKRMTFEAAHRQESLVCPPSPDDDFFLQKQEEALRAQSYSSVNSNPTSQLTSPSDLQSPLSTTALSSTEQFFPSVPSLPALVSGASSVSADTEGEMLQQPGVVRQSEVVAGASTPDTVTPPSLSKEQSVEIETPTVEPTMLMPDDAILLSPDEDEGYQGDGDNASATFNDDSDSDEGLTMSRAKPKRKGTVIQSPAAVVLAGDARKMERRDTNASVGSTETAKKILIDP